MNGSATIPAPALRGGASIIGIGTWLPEHVRTNDAWPASFVQREHAHGDRTFNDIPEASDPLAAAILARDLAREAEDPFLGAVRRHVADDSISAADAETLAARAALADAGVTGADVDLVISYSIVPDHVAPASAGEVAHHIGAQRALGFGVETACASIITQLEIAHAYIGAGLAKTVLLTQSHLLLRTFAMEHPASPGLGDAASAVVVANTGDLRVRATFGITHGDQAAAVGWVRGREAATDLPWWRAGNAFHLGSRAPHLAKALMRDTVSYGASTVHEVSARAGIDVERIGVLASVQPRGFLPGGIVERLGLARDCAVTTYEDIAHVGACGPVFNLQRAREQRRLQPGTLVALYAQGAGFTRSAAVLQVI
jgi:3-oxoacyl-[acyl-carrier-protein] synthase-3